MSERARLSLSALILALVFALSTLAALPAAAQSVAELSARRDSVERRYALARLALEQAENRARAVPDDSLLLHGSVLRFSSANLEERERRSLTRAFDAVSDELTALFGADGASLLNGQAWLVTVMPASRLRSDPGLVLEALGSDARSPSTSLSLPLNIPTTAALIRRQAGRNLLRSQPRLRDWFGDAFGIAEPTATHYFAHRQLALHQSTPARRCARGNIPACADIFSNAARSRWFDPGDAANSERPPASGMVRESLLRYAVEVDGAAVLRAVRGPADNSIEPLPFLAAAVGQEPEEFLSGWQARLAASGAVRVRALPRTVLAAFGWFALCGIVATRRRPT